MDSTLGQEIFHSTLIYTQHKKAQTKELSHLHLTNLVPYFKLSLLFWLQNNIFYTENFWVEHFSKVIFCCKPLIMARNAVQSVKTDKINNQTKQIKMKQTNKQNIFHSACSLNLLQDSITGKLCSILILAHFVNAFYFHTPFFNPWDHFLFCSLFLCFIILERLVMCCKTVGKQG